MATKQVSVWVEHTKRGTYRIVDLPAPAQRKLNEQIKPGEKKLCLIQL